MYFRKEEEYLHPEVHRGDVTAANASVCKTASDATKAT